MSNLGKGAPTDRGTFLSPINPFAMLVRVNPMIDKINKIIFVNSYFFYYNYCQTKTILNSVNVIVFLKLKILFKHKLLFYVEKRYTVYIYLVFIM